MGYQFDQADIRLRKLNGVVADGLVPEKITIQFSFNDGTAIGISLPRGINLGMMIIQLSSLMDELLKAYKEDMKGTVAP